MSEVKDTNPKDAVGTGKTPFSTIPSEVVAELGLVMLEGARKYGRHNYRAAGVRASVYFDAAMRHLTRFWEGEETDPDSGMPHLIHAMACCAVLRDSQVIGNWSDDRPPKLPDGWMVALNEKAAAIVEKYPNAVEAHTQLASAVKFVSDSYPTVVYALNEEWMREFEWRSEYFTYKYFNGRWQFFDSDLGLWDVSSERTNPGQNGPFTRIEP